MELRHYVDILRRRWWLLLVIPLLVALWSGLVASMQPARYGLTLRLLVTRGDAPGASTAGLTDQGEDKTALDLPAIVSGTPFRHDLAEELARRGRTLDEETLRGALIAQRQDDVVTILITSARPEDAPAIAAATVDLIRTNGLRYWGDPHATPAQPGLYISVLDLPAQAVLLNGPRALAVGVALRTLLGLVAAVGLVFLWHYLAGSAGDRQVALVQK